MTMKLFFQKERRQSIVSIIKKYCSFNLFFKKLNTTAILYR